MPIRDYAGGAKRTTLSASITAASTTINVTDGAGYPTGAVGPFAIVLDVGLAGEEKVLCATRTSNTLTVATSGRGYDGTSATAHSGGTVDHCITAIDIREANAHGNDTTGDPHPQYLTPAEGNAAYLTAASADALFLTPVEGDAAYAAKVGPVVAATVVALESTTSGAFVDLTTAGPVATVVIGASGRARVDLGSRLSNTTVGGYALMAFAVSGATTVAASSGSAVYAQSAIANQEFGSGRAFIVTGLTPGSNTFTAKYLATGAVGQADFSGRQIIVTPL